MSGMVPQIVPIQMGTSVHYKKVDISRKEREGGIVPRIGSTSMSLR